MTTSIDTQTYLDGQGTDTQQFLFQRAATQIQAIYTARHPDDPEDLDGMVADQLAGAAQYALGDLTVEEAGQALAAARQALTLAEDTLAGVMVAAREQGESVTTVAAAAGVTRQTVYNRTEAR